MACACNADQLKNNLDDLLSKVLETGEPLFIDRGGQADVVVVDADCYLRDMQALAEFERIFAQGNRAANA